MGYEFIAGAIVGISVVVILFGVAVLVANRLYNSDEELPSFGNLQKRNQEWKYEDVRRYKESVQHVSGLWINPVKDGQQ